MNRKILIIAAFTLLIDQLSKVVVANFIKLNEEIVVIQNFFSLHYINNYGAAWNILNNKTMWLILFSLIALIIIYRFMYLFKTNPRNNLAFGLIVGGLVGNLIDRWLFGYVRDFLDFRIFKYDYPIFNLADTAIVIGVFLLIYAIMRGEDHCDSKSSNEP